MKIIDNGKEYIYTMRSGEEKKLEYGSILAKISVLLKNANIKMYYARSKDLELPDAVIIDDTPTYNIEHTVESLLKILMTNRLFPNRRPDQKKQQEILFDVEAAPQREIIIELLREDLFSKDSYKGLLNRMLGKNIEQLLIGEDVGDEIKQELLQLRKITYVSSYYNNSIVREIELISLGQVISLEVENVLTKKNPDVVFKKCIQCGNIFVTCMHAGNQDKLCSYKYTDGLCKNIRKKELSKLKDSNPYEKIDNKVFDRMYKKREYDVADQKEMKSWKVDYLSVMDPYKNTVSIDEYKKISEATWKEILKKIKLKK